ncbi:MAG: hypothetical protein SO454_07470 [Candidatus Choladocola sp.]|nr:hypothetical protein [Candidatus Choladocola sp.]
MIKVTRQTDPELAALVDEELNRQEHNIEMIASESTAPLAVMELSGSVFTNKTLEGYPGKRFQAGSEVADKTWSFKYAASQEFHDIMAQVIVNAKCLAEELQKYGFRIVSGGTDNHLLVVDLRSKGLTGKTMQNALDAVGITVNKNMIPFDPEKPGVTSGIRIGLTAVSQRGLKEPEIREIAAIINQVAEAPEDEANLKACKAKAEALIAKFPLYPAGSFDD